MNLDAKTYQSVSSDSKIVGFRRLPDDSYDLYKWSFGSRERHWKESAQVWAALRARLELRARTDGSGAQVNLSTTLDAGFHLLHDENHLVFIDKAQFQAAQQEWGIYHPRVWRGRYRISAPWAAYNALDPQVVYGQPFSDSLLAASSLNDELLSLFRFVEPSGTNRRTYSHRIRELLILACTEIEAAWRGALEENTNPASRPDRYNTTHYVRLLDPMRLASWAVRLDNYSDFPPFKPFEMWNAKKPSESLGWYAAYNATKHDRASSFDRATLGELLEAMAALHVMQCAQWGPEIFDAHLGKWKSPYRTVGTPTWEAGELYVPAPPQQDGENRWTPTRLFG